MQPAVRDTLSASVFFCSFLGLLPAQGMFVNYEDPQVKPIAVVTGVGTSDYVLACNTPDNSVEIYRAEWNLQAPIARVPVGLSPVTVKWDAGTGCFYTCNYLGDSVTKVKLNLVPASGSSPQTVDAVIERTEYVGNEPTDIAFKGNGSALVTLHAQGLLAEIQLGTLAITTAGQPLVDDVPPSWNMTTLDPYGPRTVLGSTAVIPPYWALKQARRIEIQPATGRQLVLNTMGGEVSTRSAYDLGLFSTLPSTGATDVLSGLGSTNFGCAVNAAGTRMYVVSQIARNFGQNGGAAVKAEATGFVQTWLQVVDLSAGAPVLEQEQAVGVTPVANRKSINLNRNYNGAVPPTVPVGSELAQVTDVILIPDPTPGKPERIVMAAFGSEKVAVFKEDLGVFGGYQRVQVTIPPISPANSYSAVGPRGLAWSAVASQPHTSTPGLVFVLNRLDNSLAVVNPWNSNITRRALANDPTPPNIRAGRKFLYTAAATSGNLMVSCSSCHVDGRTDGMRWRLGDSVHSGSPIPGFLVDGYNTGLLPVPTANMPMDKPELVTQTLQGLVNYHLEPDSMQFMATNAPYHWRGDKPTFQDFNEAFVNLQGMTSVVGGSPSGPNARGLSNADMDAFTSFVNTIHHPPNPEQSPLRVYTGATGNVDQAFDPAGSGALLGRKLYHIVPAIEGRACANCHSLPDGSSNTMTIAAKTPSALSSTTLSPDRWHPMETAALRNVVAREALVPIGNLQSGGAGPIWPLNGTAGLHHGGVRSLSPYLDGVVSVTVNDNVWRVHGVLSAFQPFMAEGLTAFLRQLDTGTAPLIGFAWTMTTATLGDPRFVLAISQAKEANVGVAAFLRTTVAGVTQKRGFWCDVTANPVLFRQENSAAFFTENQLVQQLAATGDVLIVQVTPAGSERRVASLTGTPATLAGSAPSNLRLLAMVPDTAYQGITAYTANIDPNPQPGQIAFTWLPNPNPNAPGPVPPGLVSPVPTPISQLSQRTFVRAISPTAGNTNFGVPFMMRHEPPRRFRIAGDNIRNGAKLGIEFTVGAIVWFDLSPTDRLDQGSQVWETAEELDALQTMALLCGGYWAPGVTQMLLGTVPAAGVLNPLANNSYRIQVLNDNGQLGISGWAPLTISATR